MWKRKATETVFKHPRMELVEDTVELPSGVETQYLRINDQKNIVIIIVQKRQKFLLLHEYAYPVNTNLFQMVEGEIEADESWETSAQRELREEAGLKANSFVRIGEMLAWHRRTDAIHNIILATELTETDAAPELEEEMTCHWFTQQEIMTMIANGDIIQKNTLAAWSVFLAWSETEKS